ncbi:MAG: DMT family transporter [Paracoccus sp. (in: a-proteobacteria)]|nr:DMT family transporter [Paracoccus sp. (in: a-proteobacteria)]
MTKSDNLRGAAYSLIGMAIYAAHDAIIKLLGGGYPPHQVLFFASLMTFPFVTVMLLGQRRAGTLRAASPLWVGLRSACIVLASVSNFYALSVLPLAQFYVLIFTMPLLVTVLAIPILGERVGIHRWLAVAMGLSGVLIVLNPTAEPLSPGHIAAMVGAILGAAASVIIRRLGTSERAETLILWPMIGNLALTGVMLGFDYQPMAAVDLALTAVIALFGLVAAFLIILSYRAGEAAVVAPMQYSQILWASFYGWLLFGEGISLRMVIGIAVIIASGLYIVMRERRMGHSANRPAINARLRPEVVGPRASLLQRLLR